MVSFAEIPYECFNISLFHQSCRPVTMGLEDITDLGADSPGTIHQRFYFVRIVGIIINDQMRAVVQVNIETPFNTRKIRNDFRNSFQSNSLFRKQGNTCNGIIEIIFAGEGELKLFTPQGKGRAERLIVYVYRTGIPTRNRPRTGPVRQNHTGLSSGHLHL